VNVVTYRVPELDHPFESLIARFHSAFHSCREHGCPRLSIRQSHAHGHYCACAVRLKPRFNVVVGRRIRQVHPLDMNDPAVRLKFVSVR
jgi:hypothetical protein